MPASYCGFQCFTRRRVPAFGKLERLPGESMMWLHTTSLTGGLKYYYIVASADEEELESEESSKILRHIAGTNESGGMDVITWGPERIISEPESYYSSCFIPTAAYSAGSAEVGVLRAFRDVFLPGNRAGRAFTASYYSASPAGASVISENKALRFIPGAHLTPVVKGRLFLYLNHQQSSQGKKHPPPSDYPGQACCGLSCGSCSGGPRAGGALSCQPFRCAHRPQNRKCLT